MNEWNRLGDISTGTRRYLSRPLEQRMVQESAAKIAKIHRAKMRLSAMPTVVPELREASTESISMPFAVELPGDMPVPRISRNSPPSPRSYDSGGDHISLPGSHATQTPSPRSSGDVHHQPQGGRSTPPPYSGHPAPRSESPAPPPPISKTAKEDEPDRLVVAAPTPSQYRTAAGTDKIAIMADDEHPRKHPADPGVHPAHRLQKPQQPHHTQFNESQHEPPPVPPKTPLDARMSAGGRRSPPGSQAAPPYPMYDGPPPAVNMARKPDYRAR
jgi:hypothetical protein